MQVMFEKKRDAYVGIDVAFAKKKVLPVSVCTSDTGLKIEILPLRVAFEKPPVGRGNVAALEEKIRQDFAGEVLAWLAKLEQIKGLTIRRIAIDAPSDYCRHPSGRRASEAALDSQGISCFATPTEKEFKAKIEASRKFLADGGKPSRLPNANQLWMLVGFELFRTLEHRYECIETYPQAIVRALKCASRHKSTVEGLQSQLDEAAKLIGVKTTDLRAKLLAMGFGSAHDRLDAFLSAYVASLDESRRRAFGTLPEDAIWVPIIQEQRPTTGLLTGEK
jgi:hypothetical protein